MIRNIALYCIGSILFIACDAADENRVNPHPRAHAYLKSEIQGDWQLVNKIFVPEKQSMKKYDEAVEKGWNDEYDPVADTVRGTIIPVREFDLLQTEGKFLHIVNDSIFWLNYPHVIHKEGRFRLRSNMITSVRDTYRMHVEIKDKNTLKISYLNYFGLYLEETYKKVDFDDSLIQLLKTYKLNYPELTGSWSLIRESNRNGENYFLDFPHEVADSIVLSRPQLIKAMRSDRGIYFLTDGAYRKYFLSYEDGILALTPDSWFDLNAYHRNGGYGECRLIFDRSYLSEPLDW
jgi:hypothetical protein